MRYLVLVALMAMSVWAGQPESSIRLAWDGTPGAIGYRVHYGTSTQTYTTVVDTGLSTTASIGGLTRNRRYYFAATAVYPDDESDFSNEVNARARGQ
jgi:hypothetical protein